jgi:phosphopantetheine adenylyltransferase
MYLPCDPKLKRVSSTMVRKLIEEGKSLDGILMPIAIEKLKSDGIILS